MGLIIWSWCAENKDQRWFGGAHQISDGGEKVEQWNGERKQEIKGEGRKTWMRKRAREGEKAAGRRQTWADLAQIMN